MSKKNFLKLGLLISSFVIAFTSCGIPNSNNKNDYESKNLNNISLVNNFKKVASLYKNRDLPHFLNNDFILKKSDFSTKAIDTSTFDPITIRYSNLNVKSIIDDQISNTITVHFSGSIIISGITYIPILDAIGSLQGYVTHPGITKVLKSYFLPSGTCSSRMDLEDVQSSICPYPDHPTCMFPAADQDPSSIVTFNFTDEKISIPKYMVSKGTNTYVIEDATEDSFKLTFDASTISQGVFLSVAGIDNNGTKNPTVKFQAFSYTNDPLSIKVVGNGKDYSVSNGLCFSDLVKNSTSIDNSYINWLVPFDMGDGTYIANSFLTNKNTVKSDDLIITVNNSAGGSDPVPPGPSGLPPPLPPLPGSGSGGGGGTSNTININKIPSDPSASPSIIPSGNPTPSVDTSPSPSSAPTPVPTPTPTPEICPIASDWLVTE